jgi:hypothetical protein
MKCSKCPAPAFLRVDSRIMLCASCWNAVADRMIADLNSVMSVPPPDISHASLSIIRPDNAHGMNSVTSMDLAPCDVSAAALSSHTGTEAVARSFDDGIPEFLRRGTHA